MGKSMFLAFLFGAMCSFTYTSAQVSLEDPKVSRLYGQLPQERIYIHYNSSFFLVGERLFYKMYCLDTRTNSLSAISKIAYVELIGEGGKIILTHKVKLENGLAQGDFFIPRDLRSGLYKIIGYTRWMKNEGPSVFFQGDLGIVNPYSVDQKSVTVQESEASTAHLQRLLSEKANPMHLELPEKSELVLELSTDADTYGRRKPVQIHLESKAITKGNFSISVRKKDSIGKLKRITAFDFKNKPKMAFVDSTHKKSIVYLPEIRGELIWGSVVEKESKTPPRNPVKVAMFVPGSDFDVYIDLLDENGLFFFNLNQNLSDEVAILQVFEENKEDYELELNTEESLDYSGISFEKLVIDPKMKDPILQRSIYNQIQNAYNTINADTILSYPRDPAIFREYDEEYELDDYTRFNILRETMVEVVNHVWYRRDSNGRYVFQIRGFEPFIESETLPLVVLDGTLVQSHESIMNFDTKKVKKISVNRKRIRIGAEVFQGLIAIETFEGNFNLPKKETFINHVSLSELTPLKKYFRKTFMEDNSKTKRIPDFRSQLLWAPNVELRDGGASLKFFTSDNKGLYEICLEGFLNDGTPVSIKKNIKVK